MLVNRMALRVTVLAGLLVAMLPAADAAQSGRDRPPVSSPPRGETPTDPAVQAQTQRALNEGVVANDRGAAIRSIMSRWAGASGNAGHLETTLNAATNTQLAQIMTATGFEQVRAILLGQSVGGSGSGGLVAQNLGDLNNDLTYTPVNPPCRIFDTRNFGGGAAPAAGSTSNYQVHGTGAQMSAQGGNAAGCPAPKGEPLGVAANFTAVPLQTGHLRVFPFGASLPVVSFLNFQAGVNIANAGIVSTCYLCAADLSVFNAAQTHQIGDVMGYFYPVSLSDPALNQVKAVAYNSAGLGVATIPSDSALRITGSFTTHTTAAGDQVHITSTQALGTTTSWGWASALDLYPCYRVSPAGALTSIGGGMLNLGVEAVLVDQRAHFSVTGVVTPGAGTFNFGMCYRTSDAGWVNNEWGYTSTTVLNPLP